ncbi:hypothetical protein BUALT_Bualt05G0170700 [Buddleja alternifolia]|uniref:J domain-containing protein n=1 Tax=Buddleja alternifolia TaxID=168488 RepID=A0AAV6XLD1_9LAMI|nr:hypothetical protein BUALT_Bualt05G0170700 [Buddleja alternifolia]
MECNRDEAMRAKEIAERKFLAKDINGAKKFALKAQKLYAELKGISQLVMTLEVYSSAEEEKINGETNWYSVLGVTPLADNETVKRQYRKLALLLHPDKNRCVGAEGAFHLVSQAWSLLSDKSKKIAYDQRHSVKFKQRNQSTNRDSSSLPKQNGSKLKVAKGNSSTTDPYSSHKKEKRTFWTVCNLCKVQYEYLRMYLNQNLLCPNCQEGYFAFEVDPPSTKCSKTSFKSSNSKQQKERKANSAAPHTGNSGFSDRNESDYNNCKPTPFSESTAAAAAVQAANMVKRAYEKVQMEKRKAKAASRREEALLRKNLASKRRMCDESSEYSNSMKRKKEVKDCGTVDESMKRVNCESGKVWATNFSELKHCSLQKCMSKKLMMETASVDIRKKLNEPMENKRRIPLNKLNNSTSRPYLNTERVERISVKVPHPDLHVFDNERTSKHFRENQVWAVYDDDDGMPRHYTMIHNVISLNPFKVKMSWLNSLTNTTLAHISWFRTGCSKTCGDFVIGRGQMCNSIDAFSHNVRYTKCTSRTIQIFPQKGDVWALYRNWSCDWNELTEDEVIHKYDMVEVLENYDEEMGVIVIPLVKVAGFKAVFHQHFDPMEIKRIPNEEMCRFSHQVPSHLLTGREGSKSLKGCVELDPKATPLEILGSI